MVTRERILRSAKAVEALAPAVSGLAALDDMHRLVESAVARGHFTPGEDDQLWSWYARYLTARHALQEVVHELQPETGAAEDDDLSWQAFIVAYTASALLVRAARYLVEDLARDGLVRRKLNERNPRHRIPRKQFTAIYRNLTHPLNAWRLRDAVALADRHRDRIESLSAAEPLAGLAGWLEQAEPALRVVPRRAFRGHIRYRWHAWRRRGASSLKLSRFKIFEAGGRLASSLRGSPRARRVSSRIQRQLEALLEPGDVIVTRRRNSFTNLLFPGFWPHAMLYLGDRSPSAGEPILEARKDGVRLRTTADAWSVDALSVIRPRASCVETAIERALTHLGKLYDFDFDFFTSDRIVCTELIYRTYDGLDGIEFRLIERAGKPTLTAEDILAMAVNGTGFEPVAVFGIPGTRRQLVRGERAGDLIAGSLAG